MNRRDLMKGMALTAVAPAFLLTSCKPKPGQPPLVDQIISGLQLADQVDQQLMAIIAEVNTNLEGILGRVDTDLRLVIKVYEDYDTAAGATPSNATLLRSTIAAIQTDLTSILDAIGVKNPTLISTVRVAVLIINTALTAVLGRLPAPIGPVAQAAQVSSIGVIPNATVAQLKQTWNNEVSQKHPEAVIK